MALLQQQQQEAGGGGLPEPGVFTSGAGAYRPSGAPPGLLTPSRLAGGHPVHGLGPGHGLPVRHPQLAGPGAAGRLLRGQQQQHAGGLATPGGRPRSRGSSRDHQPGELLLDPIIAAAGAAAAARFAIGRQDSMSQASSGDRSATAPPGMYYASSATGAQEGLSIQQQLVASVGHGALLALQPGTLAAGAMAAAAPAGQQQQPGRRAQNTRRAAAARRAALNSALVLAWLPGKHDQELQRMKGQSSTWYFLEQLHISALRANVTIALTSSITKASAAGGGAPGAPAGAPGVPAREGLGLAGSSAGSMGGGVQLQEEGSSDQGPAGMLTEVQRVLVRGMLSRLSGSSGLQLINVSDIGLQLSALDERNRLVNQVGLTSLISNHYTWRAYAELRKVRARDQGAKPRWQ